MFFPLAGYPSGTERINIGHIFLKTEAAVHSIRTHQKTNGAMLQSGLLLKQIWFELLGLTLSILYFTVLALLGYFVLILQASTFT